MDSLRGTKIARLSQLSCRWIQHIREVINDVKLNDSIEKRDNLTSSILVLTLFEFPIISDDTVIGTLL